MKILLVQGTVYYPTYGGANKSNRLLLEALAARGHDCRVVAPSSGAQVSADAASAAAAASASGVSVLERAGVKICAVSSPGRLREQVMKQARLFDPDWVLVASEDPGQSLLEAGLTALPGRVIYLARTTLALPFGPGAAVQSERATGLMRRAEAIVTVSDYLRDYIARWADIDSVSLPIALYGSGPFAKMGRFGEGSVTIINACEVKGVSIFEELARRMPHLNFAAVASWGTTEANLARLNSIPNVRVLQPVEDISVIYENTQVLIAPSLWAEARGRVITEAMLHAIPVLASDVGGTREAKLGVDYLLPVREIEQYERRVDSRMMPVPVVPRQDVGPWEEALTSLTESRQEYERVSVESRDAAVAHAAAQTIDHLEDFLLRVRPGMRVAAAVEPLKL